jgi:Sulfatase
MEPEELMSAQDKDTKTTDAAVSRRKILLGGTTLAAATAMASAAPIKTAQAQQQRPATAPAGSKPNILIIWGDDIGIANISAYSSGLMGYETPNIDRIGREGIRFLQYYGEQSCTAGRAAFLTGQHGIRTGLTKVGFPGAPMGMSQLDPSVGGLLKNRSCPTIQRTRLTLPSSARVASLNARRLTGTTPRSIRASAGSASRRSRILVRSPRNAWRRSTMRLRLQRSTS